jgi:hypothetical protein
MRKKDLILSFVFCILLGFGSGILVGLKLKPQQSAPEVAIDPRIGEDIQELDRRTKELAGAVNTINQQIPELYSRTEQLKAFLESLLQPAPEARPNALRANQ